MTPEDAEGRRAAVWEMSFYLMFSSSVSFVFLCFLSGKDEISEIIFINLLSLDSESHRDARRTLAQLKQGKYHNTSASLSLLGARCSCRITS